MAGQIRMTSPTNLREALLVAGLLLGPARAQDLTPDPQDEAALQAIEDAFEKERWAAARGMIVELVADREETPLLRERAERLVAIMAESDFRQSYTPPRIHDLFAGKVKKYDARGRRIEVEYTSRTPRQPNAPASADGFAGDFLFAPRDFVPSGDRQVYTVPFSGPYEMDIWGKLPANGDARRQPELLACIESGQHIRFTFTWPTRVKGGHVVGDWTMGASYRLLAEAAEARIEEDTTPGLKFHLMYGEKYKLKIDVRTTSVVATLNGFKYLSVDKPRDVYGNLALAWCPNIEAVVIKGEVDAGWLQSRYDEHMIAAREKYMQRYVPPTSVPDWFADAAG